MNEKKLTIPPIGENLKRERLASKLSQGSLAQASGISKAMLSQIESGRVNPTLITLLKIAHALSIDISLLINGKQNKLERFHYIAANDQATISSEEGNTTFKILTAPAFPNNLEIYHIFINPNTIHYSEPHEEGSEEYVWVTKGRVEIKSGNNSMELNSGDFILYQADLPHSFKNIDAEIAEINMVEFHKN